MYRLQNPVRHYAWGSGLHVPRLLGVDPADLPWAELWMGAHPGDPSLLDDGSRLDEAIAADPEAMLGERASVAFGRLPFLMKLLAAGEPLSLQVHPTSEQARLGFAAQEAAGVPIDAPHRSYRDTSHKPELIYALTRFEGMAGFRDPDRTASILRQLQLPWLDDVADRLAGTETAFQALRSVVSELLTWEGPALHDRLAELRLAAAAAERRLHVPPARQRPPVVAAEDLERETLRVFQQTQQLVTLYPDDAGVLVTLLLNHVVLAAGEAMYLHPGVMHAYTAGFGVEIMASSDNVLRAGLTPKHVDVAELLRITDFAPAAPPRWAASSSDPRSRLFSPPVGEFELLVLDGPARADVGPEPAIVLALDGDTTVCRGDVVEVLNAGQSVFVGGAHDAIVEVGIGSAVVGRLPARAGG